MRIQIFCDHKWRDLPNLSVIKRHLESFGHRVLLTTTKDAVALMQSFRPDCVIFNHLFGRTYKELSCNLREAGIAVIMLPTEGAMRPELVDIAAGEFADFSACELFLNWSEPAAALLRKRWNLTEESSPVVGCTRFDFYHPSLQAAITPREVFCRQHGFDPKLSIVTWATQYGYAHLDQMPRERAKFLREAADVGVTACYERIGMDVGDVPGLHAEGREATSEAFFAVAARMPGIQFIIRPHPVEDREYYRKKMRDRGLGNVRFCPSDYIWNVLNTSDIHLHRQCTTAVEAWMWHKPTIEMGMDDVPELPWADREEGSDMAREADSLERLIRDYFDGRKVEAERLQYRSEYVAKWFNAGDGRRCATAAATIHDFLDRRGKKRTYFTSLGKVRLRPRNAATAMIRYALNRKPNERLIGRSTRSTGPEDKLITRRDIKAYLRLIEPAIA